MEPNLAWMPYWMSQQWQQWPDLRGSGDAVLSFLQASSSCTSLLSQSSFSVAAKHEPCSLTLQKKKKGERSRLSKPSAWGNFSAFPTWSTRPKIGCGARSTSLWVHRHLFWQLPRDRNLHRLGMSHAMTAYPKPSVRAPWKVGDAVVGRENAGWTTSKSGHSCPCQNCSQGPPAEETGRGSLPNRPSCRPNRSKDWPELKVRPLRPTKRVPHAIYV